MTERQRIANLLFMYGEMPKDQWLNEGDIYYYDGDVSFVSEFR